MNTLLTHLEMNGRCKALAQALIDIYFISVDSKIVHAFIIFVRTEQTDV